MSGYGAALAVWTSPLYGGRAMAEDRSDDHCDLLMPILVAGYGRVGSTALMALLATDERVAFDRRYPFENRYLTYVAKLSLLASGPGRSPHLDAVQLHDFTDGRFGAMPWPTGPAKDGVPVVRPSTGDWLSGLWRTFSASVRRARPHASGPPSDSAWSRGLRRWTRRVTRRTGS